ncbi:MAG TPA: hypothetical protein VLH18_02575 [Candidatus Limnocylindrales bacterium]|nr:hypothetical protein [Candidatus Limnocylindrales bacterium]
MFFLRIGSPAFVRRQRDYQSITPEKSIGANIGQVIIFFTDGFPKGPVAAESTVDADPVALKRAVLGGFFKQLESNGRLGFECKLLRKAGLAAAFFMGGFKLRFRYVELVAQEIVALYTEVA